MSSKRIFTFVMVIAIISSFFAFPVYGQGQNLIKNGGFEELSKGVPASWSPVSSSTSNGVTCGIDSTDVHSGKNSYKMTHNNPANSMLVQNIDVEKGKIYKISFWAKTENTKNASYLLLYYGDTGAGCKGLLELLNGNNSKWQKVEAFVRMLDVNMPLSVAIRLGGQGTDTQGTASFDDVSVELADKVDAGAKIVNFYVPGGNSNNNTANNSAPGASGSKPIDLKVPLFIILGIAALGVLIYVEMKLSKRPKSNEGVTEDGNNLVEDEDKEDDSEDDEN